MKKQVPKESTIQRAIIKHLKATYDHAFVVNIHGGAFQRSGMPDIMMLYRGNAFFFEVKRPGGKLTEIQKRTLGAMAETGALCAIVRSVEDVRLQMDEWALLAIPPVAGGRRRRNAVEGVDFIAH